MYGAPTQHAIQNALLQNGVGSKKNRNIIGKNSYQMLIFAFVTWIAYRRLSLVLFSEFDTRTCGPAETVQLLG